MLPGSKYFRRLSKNKKMPVNAAILVYCIAVALTTAVIGSYVAFSAITAAATIATNFSYLFPIIARQTVGRKRFEPAKWNLGRLSPFIGALASLYIGFLCIVLLLPQLYPVTGVRRIRMWRALCNRADKNTQETLNYAPVMIGAITLISVAGWFLPRIGGRHWFRGPKKTIEADEWQNARVEGKMD